MAQVLNITNYGPTNILQETRLEQDVAKDATEITVQNTEGFQADNFIILGTPGAELTELLKLETVTNPTTFGLSAAAKLQHKRYDMVSRLFGNSVRVYRAPNTNGLQPADTAFSVMETVPLQPDRAYTEYLDVDGGSDYWYKFTYFNTDTNDETNLSDSKSMRGGGTGDYCSIEAIRIQAGFKFAPYVTDAMIDVKRQAAQDEINGTLHGFYNVPFKPPINPFISDICVRLAAGLLLVEQYGQINTLNTSNGQKSIDEARDDLKALATKQKVLVDTNGDSLAHSGSTGGVSGWPNATTESRSPAVMGNGHDGGHAFRRSDVIGYESRKY